MLGCGVEGFPGGSAVTTPPANAGAAGLNSELRRSPGRGNGNRSSILARVVPGTEEPGRLQSMRSQSEHY